VKLDSDIRVTSATHLWQIGCMEFRFTNLADDDKEGYAIHQSVWPRFTSNLTATIHKNSPIGRHILRTYR
jgi:hypothetical protein